MRRSTLDTAPHPNCTKPAVGRTIGRTSREELSMTDCKIYGQRGVLRTEHLLESLRLLQKFLTERTPLRAHFVSRSGKCVRIGFRRLA